MRKALAMMGVMTTAMTLGVLGEKDASACGGCLHPPDENPTVVTDHRMILSISPVQTTLYDQVRYQGNPSSFAWVLPINGEAKIGLSSDALFTTLDQSSQTAITAPPSPCPSPPSCGNYGSAGSADASSASDSGVTVTHHDVVGPYETVQLHSTDPNALNNWLTTNGFAIPAEVQTIITAYVNEHYDFLALKLVPGAGVQAMRPVRVTTAGASPILPLRMVAAGTGATVGVTLWMVADGRYEPQNFPTFRIDDSELVWDWNQSQSNYRALRAQKSAATNGRGWEMESSIEMSQTQIENQLKNLAASNPYVDAGLEYPPTPATDASAGETSAQQLQDDVTALFKGIAGGQFRLTRLRADLAHAALASDLVLGATADQSFLSNFRRVTASTGAPVCSPYPDCPLDPRGDGGMYDPQPGSTSFDNGGHGDSFNCAAAPVLGADSVLTFGGIAGLLGFSFIRGRRRRRM